MPWGASSRGMLRDLNGDGDGDGDSRVRRTGRQGRRCDERCTLLTSPTASQQANIDDPP